MLDLSLPTRQSKKSIVFYLFKNLRGLLIVGLYAIFGINSWASMGWSTVVILVVAAISLIAPLTQYYFFTFHIANDELIINSGFLFKQRKAIPLERIQSINVNQNILQRILAISALDIETAGSSAKEIEIPALDTAFAKALKDTLKSKTTGIESPTVPAHEADQNRENADPTMQQQPAAEAPQTILELGIVDLLKIGITQNHLKSGGVALGVVLGLWFKIKDFVEYYVGDLFKDWDKELEQTVVSANLRVADYTTTIVVAVVFFMLVSVLVSVVLAVTKYWDFKMVLDGDTLEVRMGLFNKHEVKMPLAKVQILEFHTNPLRRLLGYHTAMIYQAQAADTKKTAVEVPACTRGMQAQMHHMLFSEPLAATPQVFKPNPWSYMRLALYIGGAVVLPVLVASVCFALYGAAVVALLVLAITAVVHYRIGTINAVHRDAHFVVFSKGWLFRATIITPVINCNVQTCGAVFS